MNAGKKNCFVNVYYLKIRYILYEKLTIVNSTRPSRTINQDDFERFLFLVF